MGVMTGTKESGDRRRAGGVGGQVPSPEVASRYISRNQATVLIGLAVYGIPRAISLATLDELIEQGKIRQVSTPSLASGKLRRHLVDYASVRAYIESVMEERRGPNTGAGRSLKEGSASPS